MSRIDDPYTLLLANTNLLEVDGLTNEVTGEFINNASISATLTNMSGVQVSGQTWPVNLTYIPNSKGSYRCVLQHTLNAAHDQPCKLHISATGNGLVANLTVIVTAKIRRK